MISVLTVKYEIILSTGKHFYCKLCLAIIYINRLNTINLNACLNVVAIQLFSRHTQSSINYLIVLDWLYNNIQLPR